MNMTWQVLLPGADLDHKDTIIRELERNVVNGQGVVITMPDGFSFDLVLDEVSAT